MSASCTPQPRWPETPTRARLAPMRPPAALVVPVARGVQRARRVWWWLRRPVTIGVRVAVEDPHGALLLVRHTLPSPSPPPLLLRGLVWCYHRFSRDSFLSYPFPTPALIPSPLLPFFRLIHLLFARLFLRSSSTLALLLVLKRSGVPSNKVDCPQTSKVEGPGLSRLVLSPV